MKLIQATTLTIALVFFAGNSLYAKDTLEPFPVAGGTLLIDWRGDFTPLERQKLKTWMTFVANTVRQLHGELPRPFIRIAFQPYASNSPVPFARVLRNKPEGVLFYINPDFPVEDFISDWTAYHELSHLFIPFPGFADIWFSEGLASYYQNILQLRAGLLTAAETRQRFQAAFERGRNDGLHSDLTLGELSGVMRERLAFMRVYWTGALYFMEADIRLRQLDTPMTLDDVLRGFGTCCLAEQGRWDGLRIARDFDAVVGEPLFVPLYESYEQSRAIPEYAAILAAPEMDAILTPNPTPPALAVQ
jgi:hypothetical protein